MPPSERRQVDDSQALFIPTCSKVKISSFLSYPIGAEAISRALVSTPQLPDLRLHFYTDFRVKLYSEFLRVEYLDRAKTADAPPILYLLRRPPQSRWEIVVQPVPRALRNRNKQYIVDSALPQVAQWRWERSHLGRPGNEVLAFFHDKERDEFVVQSLTRLGPHRG